MGIPWVCALWLTPRDANPIACCDCSNDDSSDGRGESGLTCNELPHVLSLEHANASILIKTFQLAQSSKNSREWQQTLFLSCFALLRVYSRRVSPGAAWACRGEGKGQESPSTGCLPSPPLFSVSGCLFSSSSFHTCFWDSRACHALLRHLNHHVYFVQKETA